MGTIVGVSFAPALWPIRVKTLLPAGQVKPFRTSQEKLTRTRQDNLDLQHAQRSHVKSWLHNISGFYTTTRLVVQSVTFA
jgi:hypothetical protein